VPDLSGGWGGLTLRRHSSPPTEDLQNSEGSYVNASTDPVTDFGTVTVWAIDSTQ